MTSPNPFDIEALRKVFVGGLKRETTVDGMREFFAKYGTIVDIVIITDPSTHVSRGFGYVTFQSSDMVDDALLDKPHVIEGKEVEVKRAIPRDDNSNGAHQRTTKIFIGGLPKDTMEDDIHKYFSNPDLKVSVANVEMMIKDGECRGFCFVSFVNEDMVDKLTIIKYHNIKGGKKSEVKKAQPKGGEGGDRRGGGRGRGGNRGGNRGGGYQGYRQGGGGGGQYGAQQFNNGEYAGGSMGYGGGYGAQANYSTSYGDGSYGGGYGGGGGGATGDYNMGYYNQGQSTYGTGQRGRGRGGQRYQPY